MSISQIVSQVDSEKIYRHILKIEGIRHPTETPEKLNETAHYIRSEFERYGLKANDQEFKVEGFDTTFRNIEGILGDGKGPEVLVVSHYDTVRDSPGANDNGSGVAVMLESARILAQDKTLHNIRFVSFTLEERNPAYELKTTKIAHSLGLTDEHHRYTTQRTHRLMKHFTELQTKAYATGKNPSEAIAEARSKLEGEMSKTELEYVKQLEKMYNGITVTSWAGKTALIGSGFWVKEAIRTNKDVLGVLNLETLGYTSDKKNSQTLPEGMDPTMFQTHNISDVTVGNFIAVVGDANSDRLAQSFCDQCKLDSVDLSHACLQVPLCFEDIAQFGLFDVLRSDHAPFWREGIPGLMLTDTANFRYPFYHTQADTIGKLDFDFMKKVCKATIATAIDYTRACHQ
jgi:hypothetical protein